MSSDSIPPRVGFLLWRYVDSGWRYDHFRTRDAAELEVATNSWGGPCFITECPVWPPEGGTDAD